MKRNISILICILLIVAFAGCSGEENNDAKQDDKNQTGVSMEGSVISWANMKIDNPDLNLTAEQKEVVKYFDTDYIYVSKYENLQKYPKAYRDAQINFTGEVVKVIDADDDNYECLFRVYDEDTADVDENGNIVEAENYIIIQGQQSEERIIEKDILSCFGRYHDVENRDIDGVSRQLPIVKNNYVLKTEGQYTATEERFNLDEINKIAKAILGENIKIKEPILGEDFEFDELHIPEDTFYVVTPDNQSNSNFTSFEFHDRFAYIRDSKSTTTEERLFNVSADFEHYIVSVFNRDTKMMYLEYYDKEFEKIWGREFTNVDNVPYDYTAEKIYLVADNDLYTIDTKTGEDLSEPTLVGEKVEVNVVEDGIILIGSGNKDNIMKVDHAGEIVWKTSADIEVAGCQMIQIVDGNIIALLEEYSGIVDGTYQNYKTKIIVVDKDGNITLDFLDYEYVEDAYVESGDVEYYEDNSAEDEYEDLPMMPADYN